MLLTRCRDLHGVGAGCDLTVLGVWLLAIRATPEGSSTRSSLCAPSSCSVDPIIPIPTFLTTFFMIIIVITLIVATPKGDEPSTSAEVGA